MLVVSIQWISVRIGRRTDVSLAEIIRRPDYRSSRSLRDLHQPIFDGRDETIEIGLIHRAGTVKTTKSAEHRAGIKG